MSRLLRIFTLLGWLAPAMAVPSAVLGVCHQIVDIAAHLDPQLPANPAALPMGGAVTPAQLAAFVPDAAYPMTVRDSGNNQVHFTMLVQKVNPGTGYPSEWQWTIWYTPNDAAPDAAASWASLQPGALVADSSGWVVSGGSNNSGVAAAAGDGGSWIADDSFFLTESGAAPDCMGVNANAVNLSLPLGTGSLDMSVTIDNVIGRSWVEHDTTGIWGPRNYIMTNSSYPVIPVCLFFDRRLAATENPLPLGAKPTAAQLAAFTPALTFDFSIASPKSGELEMTILFQKVVDPAYYGPGLFEDTQKWQWSLWFTPGGAAPNADADPNSGQAVLPEPGAWLGDSSGVFTFNTGSVNFGASSGGTDHILFNTKGYLHHIGTNRLLDPVDQELPRYDFVENIPVAPNFVNNWFYLDFSCSWDRPAGAYPQYTAPVPTLTPTPALAIPTVVPMGTSETQCPVNLLEMVPAPNPVTDPLGSFLSYRFECDRTALKIEVFSGGGVLVAERYGEFPGYGDPGDWHSEPLPDLSDLANGNYVVRLTLYGPQGESTRSAPLYLLK